MPHLLDPLPDALPDAAERSIVPRPAPTTDAAAPTPAPPPTPAPRFALGVVILAVSPLAAADVAMAAVTASLAAGNRTIVTFPAGADTRVRHAIGSLADRLGGRVLSLATGAVLAADPDVDLGHVVPIGATPRNRRELLHWLTTDFPVDEWNERVGADPQSARALARADCAARF